jgi:hypothetical protein
MRARGRRRGAPCGANTPCPNGLTCFGGFCCAGPCNTGDPTCGATACLSGSGACNYPSAQCRAQSCTNGTETLAANCSNGICPSPPLVQPCGPYECNGASCYTSCLSDSQCVPGDYCTSYAAGACLPRGAPGAACSSNDACASMACLGGTCCKIACTVGGTCGATACTANGGACVYPTSQCSNQTCGSATTEIEASYCSNGSCPPGTPITCPLGCIGSACLGGGSSSGSGTDSSGGSGGSGSTNSSTGSSSSGTT